MEGARQSIVIDGVSWEEDDHVYAILLLDLLLQFFSNFTSWALETITDGALSCNLNLFSNLPEKIYSRGGFLISFEDEGSG